jgi:hypothetical protein
MNRAEEIAILNHVIDRSPLEQAIRTETLRVVSKAWLDRLNAVLLKRGIQT